MYIVLGGCLVFLLFYLFYADVLLKWKVLAAVLYACSWAAMFLLKSSIPYGLLLQIVLFIYFIVYFRYSR